MKRKTMKYASLAAALAFALMVCVPVGVASPVEPVGKEVTAQVVRYIPPDVIRYIEIDGLVFRPCGVYTQNFGNVGMVRMQLSYATSDLKVEFALVERYADAASLLVYETSPIGDGYKTFNVYIVPDGASLSIADNVDTPQGLLDVVCTMDKEGKYRIDVQLDAIEVTYYDEGYFSGEVPLLAAATIENPSVEVNYWIGTIFDVNEDGKVTLLDVEYVRRAIGKNMSSPDWYDYILCDINRDFKVDVDDLLMILIKYESLL